MTPQEALKELKASILGYGFQCHIETYEMAISALERQIPKKVIFMSDKSKVCGRCKQRVLSHQPYCEDCGQALDWSRDK